ncbi:MAG TPA: DUF1028 domain-containing protein [Candidatus Dormibacteraeota bacterium]|nr:DUF1028 domain-containing protein [Candidatus Dormibacteraeota bacterium]
MPRKGKPHYAVRLPALIPCRTFSIVGADPAAGECGVAVASKFLSAGAVVPWAAAGVGAIATQSHANTSYGPAGLRLLEQGEPPDAVIERLTKTDPEAGKRQVGIVDMQGRAATFSGGECFPWFGGLTAANVAVQGNILVGEQTVTAMLKAFQQSQGALAWRLLAALKAGDRAGGDRRGKQSAALLVVKPQGGYAGFNDRYLDLRVDDHPQPVDELERVAGMWRLYFEKPSAEDLVPIDERLGAELRDGLRRLGYDPGPDRDPWSEQAARAFTAFSEMENLEDRLRTDGRTDRQVLAYLREKLSKSPPSPTKDQGRGSA